MLRITGYSDKYQAFPGDEIKFYVNAEKNENYDVQIVRLIHGDTNPEGPGYKDEEIGAECNKTLQGRNQRIHGGSYIIIPQDDRLNTESFTLQAYIFPTTPDKGQQGILTKWNDQAKLSSEKKLMRKVWYLVAATYDANSGKLKLYQEPCVTPTNGGLGLSLLHPADETTAFVEATNNLKPRANDAPFLMAAGTLKDRSGRHIHGAHYKEALDPIELPEQNLTYNGKIDRPRLSKKALSKSDIELGPGIFMQILPKIWHQHLLLTQLQII